MDLGNPHIPWRPSTSWMVDAQGRSCRAASRHHSLKAVHDSIQALRSAKISSSSCRARVLLLRQNPKRAFESTEINFRPSFQKNNEFENKGLLLIRQFAIAPLVFQSAISCIYNIILATARRIAVK